GWIDPERGECPQCGGFVGVKQATGGAGIEHRQWDNEMSKVREVDAPAEPRSMLLLHPALRLGRSLETMKDASSHERDCADPIKRSPGRVAAAGWKEAADCDTVSAPIVHH